MCVRSGAAHPDLVDEGLGRALRLLCERPTGVDDTFGRRRVLCMIMLMTTSLPERARNSANRTPISSWMPKRGARLKKRKSPAFRRACDIAVTPAQSPGRRCARPSKRWLFKLEDVHRRRSPAQFIAYMFCLVPQIALSVASFAIYRH